MPDSRGLYDTQKDGSDELHSDNMVLDTFPIFGTSPANGGIPRVPVLVRSVKLPSQSYNSGDGLGSTQEDHAHSQNSDAQLPSSQQTQQQLTSSSPLILHKDNPADDLLDLADLISSPGRPVINSTASSQDTQQRAADAIERLRNGPESAVVLDDSGKVVVLENAQSVFKEPLQISSATPRSQSSTQGVEFATPLAMSRMVPPQSTHSQDTGPTQLVSQVPDNVPRMILFGNYTRSETSETDHNSQGSALTEVPATQGSQRTDATVVTQVLGTPRQEISSEGSNYSSINGRGTAGTEVITSDNEDGDEDGDEDDTQAENGNSRDEVSSANVHFFSSPGIAEPLATPLRPQFLHENGDNAADDSPVIIPATVIRPKSTRMSKAVRETTETPFRRTSKRAIMTPGELSVPDSEPRPQKFRRLPFIPETPSSQAVSPVPKEEPESIIWAKWNDQYLAARFADPHDLVASALIAAGAAAEQVGVPATVVFSNGEEASLPLSFLRRMDLRVGDKVKAEDNKKVNYTISELLKPTDVDDSESGVALNGYSHARVETSNGAARVVPLMRLYMTLVQVTNYLAQRDGLKNLFKTTASHSPVRRPKGATSTHSFAQPAASRMSSGIFSDCVFAISAMDEKDVKSITEAITRQGGVILENGLQDLFDIDYDLLEIRWGGSRLGIEGRRIGGVVAKSSVRTPKYLEGLALGWPCLSRRFVEDAVEEGALTPWEDYILAAGLSDVLHQSACSYDIRGFYDRWRRHETLEQQFAGRKLIFDDIVAKNIYLLQNDTTRDPAILFLLMCTTSPGRLVVVGSLDEVPAGSVVVDMSAPAKGGRKTAPAVSKGRGMVLDLLQREVLPETVVYGRQWVIQCVINRRVV